MRIAVVAFTAAAAVAAFLLSVVVPAVAQAGGLVYLHT
jgi:hypothetical protein